MPRIVIYGVGQYGGLIARLALQKGWKIVAAFNRSGDKIGKDLGRVIGLDRDLGIIVQDSEQGDYAALRGKADIGVVTTTGILRQNMPAYERLMGAGLNLACHGAESYYPFSCDREIATALDALAKNMGVTFTGCGIWDMSRIWAGLLTIGPCTEIRSITHSSITNVEGQMATREQAAFVGVGLTTDEFIAADFARYGWPASYTTVVEQVLAGAGYNVTEARTRLEPIQLDVSIISELMGATYLPGTCIGTRVIGEVRTSERVTGHMCVEARLFQPGEVEHTFWSVDGLPRTRVRVERDDPAHATAANLFNRIPQIIAARPGIVTVSELGPMQHSALVGAAPPSRQAS